MSQYSELKQALQPHLNWHGARLSFLTLFLLALVKVKTVNLSELALGFEGKAQAGHPTDDQLGNLGFSASTVQPGNLGAIATTS